MDKTFHESATPTVIYSNWPFYVHEDNIMHLEIEGSNLSTEIAKGNLFDDPIVEVNVVTPEGNIIYTFVKQGEEITEDFSMKEQIALYRGEWKLNISFLYHSEAEKPSNLKISAVYEKPSEEDITWLKDNRL